MRNSLVWTLKNWKVFPGCSIKRNRRCDMKYREVLAAMSLITLMAAGLPALAEEHAPPGTGAPYVLAFDERPGSGGPPPQGKREEAMKKVETLKKWRLIEELNLDEKTADRFLPMLSSIDRERRELMKERREAMRRLREALNSPTPGEREIKQGLKRAESVSRKLQELHEKELNAAREHLTYEQQARYLIFNQEFEREMRRIISRARGRRPGGQGREGGPMYEGQGREGGAEFGGPEGGSPPFAPGGRRY
jgi:Spy/CpxP family protein refolding chaperone